MSISVDVSEVEALIPLFQAAARRVSTEAEQAIEAVARATGDHAQAEAPFLTGELEGSIYVRDNGPLSREIGTDVEHGYYQEFGTSVMPAQPWLYPQLPFAERELAARLEKLLATPW